MAETKILVTGGAGYVGSILCERLLAAGHKVTALDNLMHGQSPLFHLCANPKFDFIRGDVRDEGLYKKLVSAADLIIPLAAIVGAPACDRIPDEAEAINYGAIKRLNSLRSSSQRVLFPVTNSGYGTKSGDVYCTEDTPLEPISHYGRTKVRAEAELLGSKNAATFRLATVFGASPRMRLDLMVNHFVYAAVTDGYLVLFEEGFRRNFVHIRDVADCFAWGIENGDKLFGKPWNLGLDSANCTKKELADRVASHVKNFAVMVSKLKEDPDKRDYIVSSDRLKKAGFEAKRTLDDGIEELIKTYRLLPPGVFKNA